MMPVHVHSMSETIAEFIQQALDNESNSYISIVILFINDWNNYTYSEGQKLYS